MKRTGLYSVRCAVAAVSAVCAWPGAGALAEVRVTAAVSSHHVYIGDEVRLTLRMDDASPGAQPEVPSMDGFTVRSLGGGSSMSSIRIINGRMTRESYTTFNYVLTPTRSGSLTIPPISVIDGGKRYASQPIVIEVIEPQQQDIVFLELRSAKSEYWIEQAFTLELRIWLRRIEYAGQLRTEDPILPSEPPELNVPWLTELPGCQTSDLESFAERYDVSSRGVGFSINGLAMQGFWPTDRELARFRFAKERRRREGLDGQTHDYYMYTMSRRFLPTVPGTLRIEPVRFKGTVPLEVTSGGRVKRDETVVVLSNPLELLIKDPPAAGRPPSYTGAIGMLSMEVTAKPTEVSAGDPITLQIRCTGEARLENVGPPPLADNATLTKHFKVPEDPIAGVIEGRTKTFTQSIRPLSEEVAEIPSIELSYFDTQMGKYVTLASEPIPITVHAGRQLPPDAVVGGEESPGGRELTARTKGILANYTNMDELLVSQATALGWGWYAPPVASPLLYAVLWLWQRRRLRLRGDTALARRHGAARRARRTLKTAARTGDPQQIARTVGAGLLNYLADRFNLPAGGLTKQEALARLEAGHVDRRLRAEIDELLSQCEMAWFAGSAVRTDGFIERARRCVDRLEGTRLR